MLCLFAVVLIPEPLAPCVERAANVLEGLKLDHDQAAGIDIVLLVVAADEGVMPQTREHLDICRLLAVRHGIVVLNKCDKADPELIPLVVMELRDLLSKQPGVRVLMTRDQDVFVELEERAKFANRQEADLFVSIHVNSHPSRAVKGIEIYHFGQAKDQRALEVAARENGTPLNSTGTGVEYFLADLLTTKKIEESMELAWTTKESLVTHMNGHYTITDHGVKTAPFYVLRYTSMPSILAEIAYISNPSEEELLRTNVFIRDVADSLLNSVKSFLATGKPTAR